MRGSDLDGNEVEIEADELMGRLFQHELDHLHGVLMFDRHGRRAAQGGAGRVPRGLAEASSASAGRSRCGDAGRACPPCIAASPSSARRRWPCRRCGRSSPPASMSPLVVTRADKRRGRGSALVAQPGEGGRRRAGPPGAPPGRRPARRRRRPRRRRRLRADHQAARARAAADGQPALLAAAAVARRRAGGAGAAGRRRRDRCVPDGGRGGARHRAASTSVRAVPIGPTTDGRRAARRAGRRRHGAARRQPAATGLGAPAPQAGRADLRGEDRPPRSFSSTGPARRSSSTGSCASAVRGPRSAASG